MSDPPPPPEVDEAGLLPPTLREVRRQRVAASAVLGVYLLGSTRLDSASPSGLDTVQHPSADETERPARVPGSVSNKPSSGPSRRSAERTRSSLLPMLPEEEQRHLELVLDSPGLTQVELRGRSDFSKAKVSQTVSELEDRGLLYREKQGRTYRVYPGELVKDQH